MANKKPVNKIYSFKPKIIMENEKLKDQKNQDSEGHQSIKENPSTNSNDQGGDNDVLKIQLEKFSSLRAILSDKIATCKLVLTLVCLVAFLFATVTVIVITLKRIYPYNNIKTNAFGATVMEDEKAEVTYWLFNTAQLWANSGVRVKNGDVITIRASGKSHTAMHHLYDDVNGNTALRDEWTGSEGADRKDRVDRERSKYRIWAGMPADALIMQVIPDDVNMSDTSDPLMKYFLRRDKYRDIISHEDIKNIARDKDSIVNDLSNIYYIGKERVDLRINQDGYLFFAVNDIVLNDNTISAMKNDKNKTDLNLKESNEKILGKDGKTTNVKMPELDYYDKHNYYNAWYDDNIGSFLITIERKK